MDISSTEAEEALDAIRTMTQKTRHSIASGGTYITLIVTGIVWLAGFTCTQFLPEEIVGYIWAGLSLLGTILSAIMGVRVGQRHRSPLTAPIAKRAIIFWLFLIVFGGAAIVIAQPTDGRQAGMLIILFAMIGHFAMGLLLTYEAYWWPLPIAALAIIGYFLLPGIFYLWLAILGGGGMIAFGLYIRFRW